MSTRRVVVTGIGIKSPVGNSIDVAWRNVVEGVSGIGSVTHFDTTGFNCSVAGEVRDFDISEYLAPKEARKMDTFIHYGFAAGVDAINDAGLDIEKLDMERVGVSVGAGIGGIASIENTHGAFLQKGPKRISPFFVPSTIINMISGHLSIHYGFKGPNLATVTACTTATHNIGLSQRLIAYGDADVMIAGGAEYSTSPVAMGGFCSARAMTTRNDAPQQASRPWDRDRDGFVLSDGAGVLVLEELEHAKARGATIYAELCGFGMSGDAFHMTAPPEDGSGARRAMNIALSDAGMNANEIDYVNAHATSTPVGDVAETQALKDCFGDHAYKIPVSSTKSMTGHLLGAAGGVEAIFTVLAIRDGVAPPTINLDNPDPQCDLNFVPHTAQQLPINAAVSNSFGFGGTNGSLVFRKV